MDLTLPGLVPARSYLIDELGRPDFRDVFGTLIARADEACTAVTRIRLTTVDLSGAELEGVGSFRVLVSELSALRLESEARSLENDGRRAANVALLRGMLESGRLEVRSAPLGGWSPDFTAFAAGGAPTAVVTGFHWFERPYPLRGPALASVHGPEAARLALRRHDELWRKAHDVGPAVWTILARRRAAARG